MSSPSPAKPVRIAIIGIVENLSNGSLTRSGALAIALARHAQVAVTLRAIAPEPTACAAINAILTERGVISQVTARTDADPSPIRLGDTLDIWGLFAHDVVVLDADDAQLRAWLTDLPAHTAPGVRILGTLDYVTDQLHPREREIALRFDAVIGTVEQAQRLFGLQPGQHAANTSDAIGTMMRGATLRTAAIHDGSTLAIASLDEPTVAIPLADALAREQLIASLAITMARRAPWSSLRDHLPS